MLPLTLQFVIAMIASAINGRMRRKLDYALEENRILKEAFRAATGTERIHSTPDQRRRLALAVKELTPKERRQCCQIVKPATILAWFRQLAARKYDSSRHKTGRPHKPRDIRKLVIEMALANEGWGYTPRDTSSSATTSNGRKALVKSASNTAASTAATAACWPSWLTVRAWKR